MLTYEHAYRRYWTAIANISGHYRLEDSSIWGSAMGTVQNSVQFVFWSTSCSFCFSKWTLVFPSFSYSSVENQANHLNQLWLFLTLMLLKRIITINSNTFLFLSFLAINKQSEFHCYCGFMEGLIVLSLFIMTWSPAIM